MFYLEQIAHVFERLDYMAKENFSEFLRKLVDIVGDDTFFIEQRKAAANELQRQLANPLRFIRASKQQQWDELEESDKLYVKDSVRKSFF